MKRLLLCIVFTLPVMFLIAQQIKTPAPKKAALPQPKTVPATPNPELSNKLILKIFPNLRAVIKIDGGTKGIVEADDVLKVELSKGTFMIQAISTENAADMVSQEYVVSEVNIEKLLKLDLAAIRDTRIASAKKKSQTPLSIEKCTCSNVYKPDKRCENAADGNTGTEWSAGGFAPQWVKLTLDVPHSISKITWVNNMSPDGQVVLEFTFYNENGELISTLSGTFDCKNGQSNTATFANLEMVKVAKVTFVKSPSWIGLKEIYLF